MQIWSTLQPERGAFQNGVVTIGNFDGLHLGHQSLFRRAHTANCCGPRIVITFDPHPLQVLHPERGLKRLFPREDLGERLPELGMDLLLILPFNPQFARLSAKDFLKTYVEDAFHPKYVVAGYDFAFGNGRGGTLTSLREWAKVRAIEVEVVEPLRLEGEIVSSRAIRDLVLKGEVTLALKRLGRPFYLRGEVVAGAGRGRQIGVPTLNQNVLNETLPALGVYITQVEGYPSVTNIGTNPTFENGTQLKVETHVLDGVHEWRGRTLEVHFLKRLRNEQKFKGVEEFKAQLRLDIEAARQYFANARHIQK